VDSSPRVSIPCFLSTPARPPDQDNFGILHEAVVSEGGVFLLHHGLVADLKRFMALWDKNLREQGFIEAARAATPQDQAPPDQGE
jgi:hypothetical protein